jgi:protein-tyrosine phosphatase
MNPQRRIKTKINNTVEFKLNLPKRDEFNYSSNDEINPIISNGPSKITEFLYLGDYGDSRSKILRKYNITFVVNVAEELEIPESYIPNEITFEKINLKDHSDEEMYENFSFVTRMIHCAIIENKKVLVHCRMGVSRSATFVIAYLMNYGVDIKKIQKMNYDDAFTYVKKRRVNINPNLGFTLALQKLNKHNNFIRNDDNEQDIIINKYYYYVLMIISIYGIVYYLYYIYDSYLKNSFY